MGTNSSDDNVKLIGKYLASKSILSITINKSRGQFLLRKLLQVQKVQAQEILKYIIAN